MDVNLLGLLGPPGGNGPLGLLGRNGPAGPVGPTGPAALGRVNNRVKVYIPMRFSRDRRSLKTFIT